MIKKYYKKNYQGFVIGPRFKMELVSRFGMKQMEISIDDEPIYYFDMDKTKMMCDFLLKITDEKETEKLLKKHSLRVIDK